MSIVPASALAFGLGYAARRIASTDYAKRVGHVALGLPIAYRITIDSGTVVIDRSHTRIDSCTIRNAPGIAMRVSI